jgi:ferric iron reductase protein FhuF
LVDGPLRSVVQAVSTMSLSPRVVWGNVASAVNGAASALAAAAPDHAHQGRSLAILLLRHPALRQTSSGEPGTVGFRRRSCCLIYRAAPDADGAVCGDCVLVGRRGR